MIIIGPVAVKTPSPIAVRGPGISHRTAADYCISPVHIDIPAVVDIDIRIPPSAIVDIYPVV
jgi:hypothetical protein